MLPDDTDELIRGLPNIVTQAMTALSDDGPAFERHIRTLVRQLIAITSKSAGLNGDNKESARQRLHKAIEAGLKFDSDLKHRLKKELPKYVFGVVYLRLRAAGWTHERACEGVTAYYKPHYKVSISTVEHAVGPTRRLLSEMGAKSGLPPGFGVPPEAKTLVNAGSRRKAKPRSKLIPYPGKEPRRQRQRKL